MKLFFGYSKYHSVNSMLIELGLPSFDALTFNGHVRFSHQCLNSIIGHMPPIFCLTCVRSILSVSVSLCMCLCVFCTMGLSLK